MKTEDPDPFVANIGELRDPGNHVAWNDLYQRYRWLIYSAAVKLGLSNQDGEEVVQDTFSEVARNIQRFKYDPARGSFKVWIMHLARWRIIDRLRKRSYEVSAMDLPHRAIETEEDVLNRLAGDIDPEVLREVDQEWGMARVRRALGEVATSTREDHFRCFQLVMLEERSIPEVAEMLGLTPQAVSLNKFRVMRRLDQIMSRMREAEFDPGL